MAMSHAARARRQVDGPLEGAVGDENLPRTETGQVLGRQLRHLAGADDQDIDRREIAEDLLRQLDRRVRHGDGVLADARVRADFLRHAHRLLEELLQDAVEAVLLFARLEGRLHLPGDLRLADDHRVESRGHPEQVLDHIGVAKDVEVLLQLRARRAAALRQPIDDRRDDVFTRCRDDHFDAVARRNDRAAVDPGELAQRLHMLAELVGHAQALAHVDRRGAMVDADED